MKTKVAFIAALAILLSVTFAMSQTTDEPVIKVLPTNNKGMVKLLYVSSAMQVVTVRFYNNDGVKFTETIDSEKFNKGFLKRYDVSKIESKDYWIEVSDDVKSITYKVVRSSDLSRFTSILEKTTYSQPVLVSIN